MVVLQVRFGPTLSSLLARSSLRSLWQKWQAWHPLREFDPKASVMNYQLTLVLQVAGSIIGTLTTETTQSRSPSSNPVPASQQSALYGLGS